MAIIGTLKVRINLHTTEEIVAWLKDTENAIAETNEWMVSVGILDVDTEEVKK